MKEEKHRLRRLGLAAALLALSGCASMSSTTTTTSRTVVAGGAPPWAATTKVNTAKMTEPPPLVQDCAIVAISSPTRYACRGKVYTSFELQKMREAWEKRMASNAQ